MRGTNDDGHVANFVETEQVCKLVDCVTVFGLVKIYCRIVTRVLKIGIFEPSSGKEKVGVSQCRLEDIF